ncbi:MAG: DUF1611 domain-containing protein [Bacteroidetes bacterium]|nr:DUF1611 domain-containing protein [Rhodothermia bacterium]MCS7155089.1 DUF1611 domain-containing protein [Bacteroidota bacterium]MCX7907195.1 DUF1611 domain-containing protein [Bacteroidota bacterium]MDW8138734.1 DUF1611 domain-containing protein [Bacteroidota bacterium]MDW8286069.1 DUF1611 domain-containing protein [Bacteroidota bacterium]
MAVPFERPIIYCEGHFDSYGCKTGNGILRYGNKRVVAILDSTSRCRQASEVLGSGYEIPVVRTLQQALAYGPDSLLIGTAGKGGEPTPEMLETIREAIQAGLHIIHGLHVHIGELPEFRELAARHGVRIWDTRKPPARLPVGSGRVARELSVPVVLTVGSDCSLGKMTVTLELHREAEARGLRSAFIATGQTGIMIAGFGVAVDAVVSDFMAGAVEELILEQAPGKDIIFVEGQGGILHAGYSGVTLGLLHGSMPSHMILCHQPGRRCHKYTDWPIQPLSTYIHLYEALIAPFRPAKVVGIGLNTWGMGEEEARHAIEEVERQTGLPTTDAVRYGAAKLLEAILRTPVSRPQPVGVC